MEENIEEVQEEIQEEAPEEADNVSFKDEQPEEEEKEVKKPIVKKKSTVRFGFVKSEVPEDAQEMEPECDLSFTSEKSDFELLIDNFDSVPELNWCWQKSNEAGNKEYYDDVAAMCLEMNYKSYQAMDEEKEKDKYRFVQFQPDLIIDLEFMCETTEKFEETGFETERTQDSEQQKRVRPESIFNKYKHPVKPPSRKKGRETNPLRFDESKVTWLANEWYSHNGRMPTRSQILKGVINADKYQMLKLFPKHQIGHASMDKVLKNRKTVWQLLSMVSGFSEEDMNVPIDLSILEQQPDHPVVQTVLYIFSMESSIRYMLNNVTKSHNEDLIMDLGPIAFAIKMIVEKANPYRMDFESKNNKFWCFLGQPLLNAQINDIQELEATKKLASESMNLFGFNAAYDRRKAQDMAWKHVEKSTTPTIFQIEFNRPSDYFKLNLPEYTPYYKTEQLILLNDGVKLEVVSSTKESIKVDGKNKNQWKICLKAQ